MNISKYEIDVFAPNTKNDKYSTSFESLYHGEEGGLRNGKLGWARVAIPSRLVWFVLSPDLILASVLGPHNLMQGSDIL